MGGLCELVEVNGIMQEHVQGVLLTFLASGGKWHYKGAYLLGIVSIQLSMEVFTELWK